MTFDTDAFTGVVNQIIKRYLRYSFPREAQVKDINDQVSKGRILVTIPSLGWETNDTGAWCYATDKNALTTVKVGDWVIVQFVDGNPDHVIYIGKSTRLRDQLPKNYSSPTDHVIFEDPDNKIHIKYDGDQLEIGNSAFAASAREGDTVQVTIPANTFIVSVAGGSGSPATGVLNPNPVDVDGEITSGSDQVTVGDK